MFEFYSSPLATVVICRADTGKYMVLFKTCSVVLEKVMDVFEVETYRGTLMEAGFVKE